MAVNQYWICVKRYDSAGNSSDKHLQTVNINGNMSSQEIKQQLYRQLGLQEENKIVLKLRNQHGSLVPINKNLRPNSKIEPYILETTDHFQNVSPSPKSVPLDIYYEAAKRRLEKLVARMEALEQAVNSCTCSESESMKLSAKAEEELKILEQKLDFLQTRFREADDSQWKGMFKRHPMW